MISSDCDFLATHGIMDYSLLLVIEDAKKLFGPFGAGSESVRKRISTI